MFIFYSHVVSDSGRDESHLPKGSPRIILHGRTPVLSVCYNQSIKPRQEVIIMGFFDQLKDKASLAGEKAGAALKDAKSKMSEGMADAKAKMDEHKALAAEAKAPIEGSIARYQVVYLGGFPKKPNGKMDPTAFGFNIMPDSFIFKPELETKNSWFGDELFTIPYDRVVKFEIVKRQVSNTEFLLSSSSDTKSLEQENNIQITHLDDEGNELMTRVEMLTGVSIYGQAQKCRELLDLLRENKILGKLNKDTSKPAAPADDPLEQLKRLNALKEAGILSDEEFNAKKAELLSKV